MKLSGLTVQLLRRPALRVDTVVRLSRISGTSSGYKSKTLRHYIGQRHQVRTTIHSRFLKCIPHLRSVRLKLLPSHCVDGGKSSLIMSDYLYARQLHRHQISPASLVHFSRLCNCLNLDWYTKSCRLHFQEVGSGYPKTTSQ
jgi:hypothetical protein